MDESVCKNFIAILESELVEALGCTEPIAIAYAGAKARQVLGKMPEHLVVACSGNIIKNVKGVTVPNSGGQRGIAVAAALGVVGGDADRQLAVLESVTEADQQKVKELLKTDFCDCTLVEGVANLYILITATAGADVVEVEISDYHTNITSITKNGEVLLHKEKADKPAANAPDKSQLSLHAILEFARTIELSRIDKLISRQIDYNTAISNEGLANPWGAQVGRVLMRENGGKPGLRARAKAAAAAGSDARMNGCALPVIINSGSGNQGITVTMPVVVYAKEFGKSHEELVRALAVANLMSIHQKKYIGSLSAYCGATSAATGAACGICFMMGGNETEIAGIITNTTCTLGGMVCDGAKSSCGAKIATAVDTALTAMEMSTSGCVFLPGEGLVVENVEDTIRNIGRMGREGMRSTDVEILNIMLGK